MSTTRNIYSAYDLTTDHSVSLEHRFTPWGSWHTSADDDGLRGITHDWLPSAAQRIADALQNFQDDDAPAATEALEAIVAAIGDNHYTVESDENGPFILDGYDLDDTDDQEDDQ